MLQVKAPFPHTGCEAFLRGTGARVTLIQRNADGSATVKLHPPEHMTPAQRLEWANRGASLTHRVPASDLYATLDDAIHCGRKPRRRDQRARRV